MLGISVASGSPAAFPSATYIPSLIVSFRHPTEGFTDKAGLEISGIRRGDTRAVRARVKEKLQRANRHKEWQTYAIVVEFGNPRAEVQKNEHP